MTSLPQNPFRFGFIATLGVLLALLLGAVLSSLSLQLTLIFAALFITLGFEPVVHWIEKKTGSRGRAVLIVALGFVAAVAVILLMIIPVVVEQSADLIRSLPSSFNEIETQDWFVRVNELTSGMAMVVLSGVEDTLIDPDFWIQVGGGAIEVGANIANGLVSTVFVVILTLYFMASLQTMKRTAFFLVPKSRRERFVPLAEEIADSVGKYLSGMVVLALMNATFSLIIMSIFGVQYAFILSVLAAVITLIPLIGSVISTCLITFVALFTSPTTALIVLICLVIYMQIEAYVLTPRIVGRAVSIPGSLVLIGALVGGALLGLLGALVAFPVAAALLLIMKKVIIPHQETR